MKQPLIILTGPTAVGKTALSIRLAKALGVRSSVLIPCRYTAIWILGQPRSHSRRWRGFLIT